MKHDMYYQCTDLEPQATIDLASPADALTNRGLFAYYVGLWQDGSWWARFSATSGLREPDQDIAMTMMLKAIESLDEPGKSLFVETGQSNPLFSRTIAIFYH